MNTLTHVDNPGHLPWAVFKMFFNKMRIAYKGKELRPQKITLKDGKGTLKKIQVGDYIYLEQNPYTSSKYALLAQRGKRILWIIHATTGAYIGRVIDGDIKRL